MTIFRGCFRLCAMANRLSLSKGEWDERKLQAAVGLIAKHQLNQLPGWMHSLYLPSCAGRRVELDRKRASRRVWHFLDGLFKQTSDARKRTMNVGSVNPFLGSRRRHGREFGACSAGRVDLVLRHESRCRPSVVSRCEAQVRG